jgi:hypothetical protein
VGWVVRAYDGAAGTWNLHRSRFYGGCRNFLCYVWHSSSDRDEYTASSRSCVISIFTCYSLVWEVDFIRVYKFTFGDYYYCSRYLEGPGVLFLASDFFFRVRICYNYECALLFGILGINYSTLIFVYEITTRSKNASRR